MSLPVLHIGSKNYSSWSMRPWLVLAWAQIPFRENVLALLPRGAGVNAAFAAVSPTGQVPALELPDGGVIWDSLAISEWAAEERPEALLWPADGRVRALARRAVCEMHAGFAALRRALPMNLRRRAEPRMLDEEVQGQVARIVALWAQCQSAAAGGPFLFGSRPGVADAFFAPVATRFRTYAVPLPQAAQAYVDAICGEEAFRAWELAALSDPLRLPETDAI